MLSARSQQTNSGGSGGEWTWGGWLAVCNDIIRNSKHFRLNFITVPRVENVGATSRNP